MSESGVSTAKIDFGTVTASHAGTLRKILRNPFGLIPLIVLFLIVLVSIFANVIAPFRPDHVQISLANVAPFTSEFLLGGDAAGRDVFSRLLVAGQLSLLGALITVVVALVLGATSGLIAGYFRGGFDLSAGWVSDVILVLPSKIVLVALFVVLGPNTLMSMAVLGVMVAPSFFRLVRTLVIGVKNELYVDAARVSGLRDRRIISRHILSVVRAPIIIQAAFTAGIAVVIQAGLEFIGLGDPNTPTWGGMLQDAFLALYTAPALLIWPGVIIGLFVGSCILLGNAIRDALEDVAVVTTRRQNEAPTLAISLPVEGAESVQNATLPSPITVTERLQAEGPDDALVALDNLWVGYDQPDDTTKMVVDGVSLRIAAGEVLGLVGESGSGKSQTAFAILGLLPSGGRVVSGSIRFDGVDLARATKQQVASLRGRRIAYVPQEPMSNLDPAFRVGAQLIEPLMSVQKLSRAKATDRALELLRAVEISDPRRVFNSFPHQISGGMAQRVLIAGAISGDPELLIADEPTTALDVTVQAEILDILRELQQEKNMAMLLVTHNFGVVADLCDRVAVMQRGHLVEAGAATDIFMEPQHPYTQALLDAVLDGGPARPAIDGVSIDAGSARNLPSADPLHEPKESVR
ncbi:dipeptide/oligopeptide/nickel ABC transporter permease/ATP-binding protein [Lysinibacter sp. HNR]|uniref:dipeptide/oligopeptide/nickel ABC transporter permease/ATP-binding protein n=1 Tax=Lysinibacter sp. HNR TaxID=3031408 RepID=UPI0024355BF3|nr:dipeptide/oligopeptide/nickel ABC transporter permease/ATP-binding protein [Lysinibacter sp. HNR]WGD37323.1 dipeptide/oligopeptide/nickel ABC transporter permease/ATP-binding protein [Lysinibacter sp. HNR]